MDEGASPAGGDEGSGERSRRARPPSWTGATTRVRSQSGDPIAPSDTDEVSPGFVVVTTRRTARRPSARSWDARLVRRVRELDGLGRRLTVGDEEGSAPDRGVQGHDARSGDLERSGSGAASQGRRDAPTPRRVTRPRGLVARSPVSSGGASSSGLAPGRASSRPRTKGPGGSMAGIDPAGPSAGEGDGQRPRPPTRDPQDRCRRPGSGRRRCRTAPPARWWVRPPDRGGTWLHRVQRGPWPTHDVRRAGSPHR